MRTTLPIAAALCLLAAPAGAQDFLKPLGEALEQLVPQEQRTAPRRTSPRPPPPAPLTPVTDAEDAEAEAPAEAPLPRPRPEHLQDETPAEDGPDAAEPAAETEDTETPVVIEPETPVLRDAEMPVLDEAAEPRAGDSTGRVYQTACPAVIQGLVEAETAPPLSEGICGEHSPLIVTAVMSRGRMVPLSSPVTTNCEMASALPAWLEAVDGYAETVLESPVASLVTGTSYQCRARNGGNESFTSEHGFANALDVVGFALEDGRTIEVEADWSKAEAPEGRLLRLAHDAGCGMFMTTLGPEANAEHHDHLHLDLGCHGKSCTTRICE